MRRWSAAEERPFQPADKNSSGSKNGRRRGEEITKAEEFDDDEREKRGTTSVKENEKPCFGSMCARGRM